MRKILFIIISLLILSGFDTQAQTVSRKSMLDSLKTIDSEVKKYFPRWKICETDLQIQIHKTFMLLGYPENELDITQIEVLAIPQLDPYEPYEILIINCGKSSMNAAEIEMNMGLLLDFISGADSYANPGWSDFPSRDYCYEEIPPTVPVTDNQAAAILDYLEPTNVTHSISLSLFDQSLKIGESMFWLKSEVGTDPVGYPFWSSGESKVTVKRPLYINRDSRTAKQIPQLINFWLGGGYRITTGLDNESGIFDFMPNRLLNGAPNGKIIAGFDFNMPFHAYAGIHFNYEAPVNSETDFTIEKRSFGKYNVPTDIDGQDIIYFSPDGIHADDNVEGIIPILKSTAQVTLFYNWWPNKRTPEDFFRFDLGLSYAEVQEYAFYKVEENDAMERRVGDYMTTRDVEGLNLYKPDEFADWLYAKIEYRSQSAFPFGLSVQYSNQIFLGRIYLPILSPWLYLEGKYSTPLRDARPYEIENFFMISPVLRIAI